MADTEEPPVVDAGEGQADPDQVNAPDGSDTAANGEVAPPGDDGAGESNSQGGDGGDGAASDAQAADVTNGDDVQQTTEEERQPTPAAAAEEQTSEEPNPDNAESNRTSGDAQATTTDAEPAVEPVPEPVPEPASEPVVESVPEPVAEPEEAPKEKTPEPTVTMTEEQMKRCRHYFDRKSANGRLDLKGFKLLCRLMGEVLSAEDADRMFQEGDRDDNGTIEFDEFCRLYCAHSQEEQSRKAAMMESIDKLFPGSDGQPVELKKVKNLLLKMQRPDLDMRLVREKSDLNSGDIHRLVNTMDKDGNGLVSKQEFVDTLCKHLDHV